MRDEIIKELEKVLGRKISNGTNEIIDEFIKGEINSQTAAWDFVDTEKLDRRNNRRFYLEFFQKYEQQIKK